MKLFFAILAVLATIAAASATLYNIDSSYVGSYNANPALGPYNQYKYSMPYQSYYISPQFLTQYNQYGYSFHSRRCIGSGCSAATLYSPKFGYSYDFYNNGLYGSNSYQYYTG